MSGPVKPLPRVGALVPTVTDRLGVRLHHTDGLAPELLLGLAVRHNPRRAQLLVSRVLGKHVPTDPRLVDAAGRLLGGLVADVLAGRELRTLPDELFGAAVAGSTAAAAALHAHTRAAEPASDALVLGFAETATALGHSVAAALHCDYLHSTRREVPGFAHVGSFTEEHSHATEHLLLPADAALLHGGRPLVLVDDELSTGRTALNTITALHALAPRDRYVVAALVDLRPDDTLAAGVAALGARLDVVALGRARVELPADLAERAHAIRAAAAGLGSSAPAPSTDASVPLDRLRLAELGWPDGLATGGRHGVGGGEHDALDTALPAVTAALADAAGLTRDARILVLGTEELMALPLGIARTLAEHGHDVSFSTTSRSPAVVVDEPGYALRTGITFPAHDEPADGPGPRYAYNLGGDRSWDHVLVVVDPPADTETLRTGLLRELDPLARRTTVVVVP